MRWYSSFTVFSQRTFMATVSLSLMMKNGSSIARSHLTFSRSLLKEGAHIIFFKKTCWLLVRAIQEASLEKGGQGEVIDLQEHFLNFRMDVFSEIAFVVELKSITTRTKHSFSMAFDRLQKSASDRMQNHFWSWERFAVRLVGERLLYFTVLCHTIMPVWPPTGTFLLPVWEHLDLKSSTKNATQSTGEGILGRTWPLVLGDGLLATCRPVSSGISWFMICWHFCVRGVAGNV